MNFVMMGFASNLPTLRRAVDMRQWAEDTFNTMLCRQGLMAATQFDTNKFNVIQLLQLTQNMVQQEQHIRMFGTTSLEIDRNIEKVHQLITVSMAGSEELLLPPLPNGKPRRKAVAEWRSADQLQVAAGRKPTRDYEQIEAELRERLTHPNVTPSHHVRR